MLSTFVPQLRSTPLKTFLEVEKKNGEPKSRYLTTSIYVVRDGRDYDKRKNKTYPFLNRYGEINYYPVRNDAPYDGLVFEPTARAMATVHRNLMKRALRPDDLWEELFNKVNETSPTLHVPTKWHSKKLIFQDVFLVFIPSSGRHQLTLINDLYAEKQGIIPIYVVKPFEFDSYVQHQGQHFVVLSLPTNNGHVSFSRAWILNFARRMRLKFMTMSDDNIEYLKEVSRDNNCEYPTTALTILRDGKAHIESANNDVAMLALPIAAYDRTRFDSEFRVGWATSFVMYNVELLNTGHYRDLNFDTRLQMFEDILFTYQCASNGLLVVRFYKYRQHKKFLNVGGCSDIRLRK